MTKRILQVNFKIPEGVDVNSPEGKQMMQEWVQNAAGFPGLVWKIWLNNDETDEVGGIYLFEDEQSLQNYLNSKTMADIRSMHDVSIKTFGIEEEPTKMTRGPVD